MTRKATQKSSVNKKIEDVTQNQSLVTRLAESERKYRELFEHSRDGIVRLDLKGNVQEANRAYLDLIGYTLDEIKKVPVNKRLPKEFLIKRQKIYKTQVLRRGYSEIYDSELIRKNKSRIHVRNRVWLIKDENNNPQGVWVIIRDISEIKGIEDELRYRNLLLDAEKETAMEGILAVDVKGKMVLHNNRFVEMWNIPPEVMESGSDDLAIKSVLSQLVHPDKFVQKVKYLYRHRNKKSRDELRFKDGRIFERYSSPMTGADGKHYGRVWYFRDVTERKAIEKKITDLNKKLRQKVAELGAVNKELESFSYSVAHDLRSPLRLINSFSQILTQEYRPNLKRGSLNLLNRIQVNAKRMNTLVNDLLSFSHMGKRDIKISRINMEKMVNSVITELKSSFSGQNIDFQINKLLPIQSDSVLLWQVWTNLLSNAMKFTVNKPKPVITVGCIRQKDKYSYFVKDNGVGFEQKYHDKLFAPFQRLHTVAEFEGTGVGLPIVKRIVERLDGHVWANGKVNKGATFYFSLPIKFKS